MVLNLWSWYFSPTHSLFGFSLSGKNRPIFLFDATANKKPSMICLSGSLWITWQVRSEFISPWMMIVFSAFYPFYLVVMATVGLYGHARQIVAYNNWNPTARKWMQMTNCDTEKYRFALKGGLSLGLAASPAFPASSRLDRSSLDIQRFWIIV